MTKSKLYKPEDMITESMIDSRTGRRIEVKSWKGNTLKIESIRC